jgi:hypothetical protein
MSYYITSSDVRSNSTFVHLSANVLRREPIDGTHTHDISFSVWHAEVHFCGLSISDLSASRRQQLVK